MRLRTTHPGFVNAVNLYFDKLISLVKPLMVNPGHCFISLFHVERQLNTSLRHHVLLSLKTEAQSLQSKLKTSMDHMLKMGNTCHL